MIAPGESGGTDFGPAIGNEDGGGGACLGGGGIPFAGGIGVVVAVVVVVPAVGVDAIGGCGTPLPIVFGGDVVGVFVGASGIT